MPFDWASLAGGAVSAIGSLFGGRSASKSAEAAARRQEQFQREFAQHGIRWRVEDAKAAGLHPLYALGAQVPSYSPVLTDTSSRGAGIADAGQAIGSAIARTQTSAQKAAAQLQLKLLGAQAEGAEIDNMLRLQELKKGEFTAPSLDLMEGAIASQMLGTDLEFGGAGGNNAVQRMVNEALTEQTLPGMTQVVPTQTPTRSGAHGYKMAGDVPALRNYKIGPGLEMSLPGTTSGDASEAWESATENYAGFLALIGMNIKERGPGWFDKFMHHVTGGLSPETIRDYPTKAFFKRHARGEGRPSRTFNPRLHGR